MFNFSIGEIHDDSGDILDAYESVISQLPKQKQKTIRDSIARTLLNEFPMSIQKPVWTGKGKDLFFEIIFISKSPFFKIVSSCFKVRIHIITGGCWR